MTSKWLSFENPTTNTPEEKVALFWLGRLKKDAETKGKQFGAITRAMVVECAAELSALPESEKLEWLLSVNLLKVYTGEK